MYSYIAEELPRTVFAAFKELDPTRVSITGHSMGGHGALTLVRTVKDPLVQLRLFTKASFFFFSVLEKPRQIQVCLGVRSDRQPHQLPLGPEGLQGVLRRGQPGEVEGARCHRADQEVERSEGGHSD